MNELIEKNRSDLFLLCERYNVQRLELFGSGSGSLFDPDTSDLDFLVEFHPLLPGQHADTYFGLLEDLQALFNCPIDLVMIRAVRNPFFLKGISPSRTVLYAA